MIDCIRDPKGNITAVVEWLLFNEQGKLDENGKTMFIGELEINPEHRGNGVIKHFIRTLYEGNKHVLRVFWWRKTKYPEREHRMYTVDKLLRRVG